MKTPWFAWLACAAIVAMTNIVLVAAQAESTVGPAFWFCAFPAFNLLAGGYALLEFWPVLSAPGVGPHASSQP